VVTAFPKAHPPAQNRGKGGATASGIPSKSRAWASPQLRQSMLRSIAVVLTIVAFGSPQSTPVIDLTTLATRNRVREPATASSSGGAVAGNGVLPEQKGPLDMNVVSVEIGHGPEPFIVFEVQVRNIGEEQFEFPVDPNLADLEPENVNTAYAYQVAYIAPLFDSDHQGQVLLPGISLYGSESITGSVHMLHRGESLRIRAKVPSKPVGLDGALKTPAKSSIKAVLMIQRDVVSLKSGVLHEDSKQIVPQITSSNAIASSPSP
jgi:hypothetical protein